MKDSMCILWVLTVVIFLIITCDVVGRDGKIRLKGYVDFYCELGQILGKG